MMDIVLGLLSEIWSLFVEMAPYLLLGFLVAGLLNLFISRERVTRHLSRRQFSSVFKASMLGVPLPLCSCGVIPVAAHLDKQGANRGATLSFLISTPTTGVDSILATYALLGPLLAIARPISALFNGLLTGVVSNVLETKDNTTPLQPEANVSAATAKSPVDVAGSGFAKIRAALNYGFVDLVEDVSKWLVIGIVAGGVISFLIPTEFVGSYLADPLISYPLMLLIGIPMYVCATGSIPIAAALIMKGVSPGAGFVFLFAGPATNTATLSFVAGKLGKKHLAIYLLTILFCSLLFGWCIDMIWAASGQDLSLISGGQEMLPEWLKIVSAALLLLLMLRPWFPHNGVTAAENSILLTIPGMNCDHCKQTIDGALRSVQGVEDVCVFLPARQVQVSGKASLSELEQAVRNAGYSIRSTEN